jgi:CheY-like chemotaxis protein
MHILICEDEHFIRRALAEHLSSLEYEVSEVENGLECLEFVSHTKPHLILMDLKMPVMDGPTAIAKLKEQNLNIPIIVLSGYGGQVGENGEYIHIQKPYRLSEVSSLIQTKFGQSSQPQP